MMSQNSQLKGPACTLIESLEEADRSVEWGGGDVCPAVKPSRASRNIGRVISPSSWILKSARSIWCIRIGACEGATNGHRKPLCLALLICTAMSSFWTIIPEMITIGPVPLLVRQHRSTSFISHSWGSAATVTIRFTSSGRNSRSNQAEPAWRRS